MIRQFLLWILLFTPYPAISQDNSGEWVEVGSTISGSVYYARSSEIFGNEQNKSIRSLWIKGEYSKDSTMDSSSSMRQYFFNCSNRTIKKGEGAFYYRNGNVDRVSPDYSYSPVIPETVAEAFFEWACFSYSG